MLALSGRHRRQVVIAIFLLPLLRHVILNDDKSSTYKLGLLRTLCRIADGAAGLARDRDDDHVALPLGLVALTWLRLYKPLLAEDLPQSPINRGCAGLGFVKAGFRQLGDLSAPELRIDMEAAASLPGLPGDPGMDDIYEADCLKRLRLKHVQQVPELTGERYLKGP